MTQNIKVTEEEKSFVANMLSRIWSKNKDIPLTEDDKKHVKRSYEAGRYNGTKTFWQFTPKPVDRDIYDAIRQVRATARNLAQNNSIMKKWLTMIEVNIAGPKGFELQVNAIKKDGTLDTDINSAVENSWSRWSKARFCDISGQMSFCEIQKKGVRGVALDGEQLTRKIRNKKNSRDPFGFQLQTLDPERIDSRYNVTLESGNIVKMGVEVDLFNRPVAYWLRNINKESNNVFNVNFEAQERERVSIDDIYFIFDKENPEQTRGMPWAYSVMTMMADLEDYLRTALIASKVGASSGVYLEKDAERDSSDASELADSEDDYGNFEMEVAPGKVRILPSGVTMKTFQGNYPDGHFVDYVSFMLKLIASGLNVSFFILANSFEEVNYTSSRTALLEERANWISKQNWYAEQFIERVFEDWLEQALLNSAITQANGQTVPFAQYENIVNNFKFMGCRWDWVDPLKDTQASMMMFKSGLKSRSQIIAERGGDYEKVLQDRAKEIQLEKQYGVSFEYTDMYGDNKEVNTESTDSVSKPQKPQ